MRQDSIIASSTSSQPYQQQRAAKLIEDFFFRYRDYISWVHALAFVFFVAVVLLPVFMPEAPETATPWDNFSVFANFVMWGLWFPLVFLSVIFTGRSWCGLLCPMGAASEFANARGLKRPIPAWIRSEWTPVASFVLVTVLGQWVGVRDHPEAMLQVFGGTMLLAIVVGYIWGRRRRAWCRHMCPIGLLLGIFSRLGAVQFTPRSPVRGPDRWVDKGPCPTLIDIHRKSESRHCIECFRCVTPTEKGGLFMRFRHPGEEVENIRRHHPNPVEIWFLFIGTGLAVGGFLWLVLPYYEELRQQLGVWFIEREHYWIGESGPWWLMSVHPERREVFVWLDIIMIGGFMLGFAALFTVLLTLTNAITAWLAGVAGADGSLRQRFIELGYQYAPVAMVSLVIGLGAELFEGFKLLGLNHDQVGTIKVALFVLALLWSLWLGQAILARQGVSRAGRILPLLPGMLGTLLVGAAWWIAIFGL